MRKPADNRYPIHELLRERWSPRSFAGEPVAPARLASLLEAARWAPSCLNEQPWRFVVATRDQREAFERLLSVLVEANAVWARDAGALIVASVRERFERNQQPNRHAAHDLGLALAQLIVQASADGLAVHAMAGFDRERARELCAIPDGFEPYTAVAIGVQAPADKLPLALAERERAPRERKPLAEIAFVGRWGEGFEA
jgi:nitroreductase